MHLRQHRCTYNDCRPFTKNKKNNKNLNKHEIRDIFIKRNMIKIAFNRVLFMVILKIYLEEQLLRKPLYDKAFTIAKILEYDRYQKPFFKSLENSLIRSLLHLHIHRTQLREINLLQVVLLKVRLCQICVLWTQLRDNQQKNYSNQVLQNLKN